MFTEKTLAERDGDGEILRLFREFAEKRQQLIDTKGGDEMDAARDALCEEEAAIRDEMAALPANSAAGMALKIAATGYEGIYEGLLCSLMRDAARICPEVAPIVESELPRDEEEEQEADSEALGALRRACEALAARYPVDDLPAGDAGLIEAERRIAELRPQLDALYRDLNLAIGKEEDLFGEIADAALADLENFIDDGEPEGFAGALVKLRLLANDDTQDDEIRARFRQILAFVERQAARAAQ
jgi:hypothetical protein